MTGPTEGPKTIYECSICQKPYVRKGCYIKHMKNVHNEDIPTADKDFLDSTTYSELDRGETILRTVGQILTADSFMHNLSDNEEEDFEDPTESTHDGIDQTLMVDIEDAQPDKIAPETSPTPSTAAPVAGFLTSGKSGQKF